MATDSTDHIVFGNDRIVTPTERVVFETDGIEVGAFRCVASHPHFQNAGPIGDHCVFVFPRTAVWIRHHGQRAFLSDAGVVNFYNPHQPYTRAAIDPVGDFCEWFAVDAATVVEATRELDPAVEDKPRLPFRFRHAPVDAKTYLAQRQLFESVDRSLWTDVLEVEERVLLLLERVLRLAYGACRRSLGLYQDVGGRQRDLAEGVRTVIATRLGAPLTLPALAREMRVSCFYLCRAFRKATGNSIHGYREQLRLRAALAALAEGSGDLTQLALDLGYSSHSHFTANFRKAFGVAPSVVRNRFQVRHELRPLLPEQRSPLACSQPVAGADELHPQRLAMSRSRSGIGIWQGSSEQASRRARS